jgi:hypothetical protein
VFALGFFEKALLVPLILLGVDIVLCGGASRGARRAVASLFVALGAVAIGFVSLWRHAVGPEWSRIGGGASFLFTYFKLSWLMLARSACGRVNDGAPLFFAVLAVLVLSTVWRRPSSAVAWVIGAVVVSVCLEVTGMSVPRSRAWGFTLHLSHRYYPDVMFVLVVFTALACQRSLTLSPIREPPRLARGFGSGICAWPALGAALSVAVTSYRASTNDVAVLYTAQSQIRDYMRNIVKGLDPLRRRRTPPPFLEGHVPKYVSPLGGWIAEHSVYVEAMGVQARVVKNTRGSYRILPTGVIVFGGAPVAR